jgi:hypothetical protein
MRNVADYISNLMSVAAKAKVIFLQRFLQPNLQKVSPEKWFKTMVTEWRHDIQHDDRKMPLDKMTKNALNKMTQSKLPLKIKQSKH